MVKTRVNPSEQGPSITAIFNVFKSHLNGSLTKVRGAKKSIRNSASKNKPKLMLAYFIANHHDIVQKILPERENILLPGKTLVDQCLPVSTVVDLYPYAEEVVHVEHVATINGEEDHHIVPWAKMNGFNRMFTRDHPEGKKDLKGVVIEDIHEQNSNGHKGKPFDDPPIFVYDIDLNVGADQLAAHALHQCGSFIEEIESRHERGDKNSLSSATLTRQGIQSGLTFGDIWANRNIPRKNREYLAHYSEPFVLRRVEGKKGSRLSAQKTVDFFGKLNIQIR